MAALCTVFMKSQLPNTAVTFFGSGTPVSPAPTVCPAQSMARKLVGSGSRETHSPSGCMVPSWYHGSQLTPRTVLPRAARVVPGRSLSLQIPVSQMLKHKPCLLLLLSFHDSQMSENLAHTVSQPAPPHLLPLCPTQERQRQDVRLSCAYCLFGSPAPIVCPALLRSMSRMWHGPAEHMASVRCS